MIAALEQWPDEHVTVIFPTANVIDGFVSGSEPYHEAATDTYFSSFVARKSPYYESLLEPTRTIRVSADPNPHWPLATDTNSNRGPNFARLSSGFLDSATCGSEFRVVSCAAPITARDSMLSAPRQTAS